jgi:hypothetical protein
MQAMIQVYLLCALDAKHFQLFVLRYRLEESILRLSQSNRFPHIDSWDANLQSGLHLSTIATFLRLPLISVALQHRQLHLAGRRDPKKSVFSSHASFFYLVPAESDEENSICWEKTYLGFYNLFVVCLGQFLLLSVLRRLSNTFLCLLWNICTLLGLIGNLFWLFCHISKQLITNYNFSKPIRPL